MPPARCCVIALVCARYCVRHLHPLAGDSSLTRRSRENQDPKSYLFSATKKYCYIFNGLLKYLSETIKRHVHLKYVLKICGLNFEILPLLDHVLISDFYHSDSIPKLWQSRTQFLRFCNQNRFEFQISRAKGPTTFKFCEMKLLSFLITNMQKFSSLLCWI